MGRFAASHPIITDGPLSGPLPQHTMVGRFAAPFRNLVHFWNLVLLPYFTKKLKTINEIESETRRNFRLINYCYLGYFRFRIQGLLQRRARY